MYKFITFLIFLFLFSSSFAAENLLTLKQQLDRLQREVNDLSQSVFQNPRDNSEQQNIKSNGNINLTAIDLRIYDLENDIKNLNKSFEELIFQIDELKNLYEEISLTLETRIINNLPSKEVEEIIKIDVIDIKDENIEIIKEENTLGTLTINTEEKSEKIEDTSNNENSINLSPEAQFQFAFDLLRAQRFDEAKLALNEFIVNNKQSQFSGSAHYWLGEIHLLNKEYREAALVLAEGYQKYSSSVKSPDMLYKLAISLIKIEKTEDACNTLKKFTAEHPNHKLINKTQNKILELNCDTPIE